MTETQQDDLIQKLAQRYSAGAAGYADYWTDMLEPMSARLLDFAPMSEAARILDVGCGPGTLAKKLRQLANSALVFGVDLSSAMLARAPALPQTYWCLMDGRRIGFPDRSFDTALLAFVLFHFPDMPAALKEIGRVLRPGGFIGTATFQNTPVFEAKRIWKDTLAEVSGSEKISIADLSAVDCVEQTDQPEKVSALLEAAGFHSIRTMTEKFQYEWDPSEYLALLASFGSSGAVYRSLSQASQDKLKTMIRQRFRQLPSEAFRFTPTVLYATARRPS